MSNQLAPCLMLQGTSSHVGKSVLATAFCRIFSDMGYKVAPFKAQNMANNSYVTKEGLEIGRAQGAQAEAARIDAHVLMNPILLKPSSDGSSQIVLNGKPISDVNAREYREDWTSKLWTHVQNSLTTLREQYDLIIIEGAGSPAEVNLRKGDIANMSVAKEVDAITLLVGDIERGGMLASVVGTLELLPKEERELIKGILVNKFRGDKSLLDPGLDFLEQKTDKPILGVLPYIHEQLVEEEDSVALSDKKHKNTSNEQYINDVEKHQKYVTVGIVNFPRISNFTDFEPLEFCPGVQVKYLDMNTEIDSSIDCMILPGTKATITDCQAFINSPLGNSIRSNDVANNLPILGICGGYQMLGYSIEDPHGVEGQPDKIRGLNLLPLETKFNDHKNTTNNTLSLSDAAKDQGDFQLLSDKSLRGYEIHMGEVNVTRNSAIWLTDEEGQIKGARSQDNLILGTYLHDIFKNESFINWFLQWVNDNSPNKNLQNSRLKMDYTVDDNDKRYDRLAEHIVNHIDLESICRKLSLNYRM